MIIIADSNSENTEILQNILNKNYNTQIVNTLKNLISIISFESPELIFLSSKFDNANSFEICKKIISNENLKNIPIIIFGTQVSPEDKAQIFDVGAADFITLPLVKAEVLHKSQTLLELNLRRSISIKNDFTDEKFKSFLSYGNKYYNLFENYKDAVQIIKNGRYVDCNKATLELLKYKNKEDFLGLCLNDISPEKQSNSLLSSTELVQILDYVLKKGSKRFEWTHKKSDGEEFYAEVVITLILNDDNERVYHTIIRDISQRKQSEIALIKSEERLENIIFSISDWVWEIDKNGIYTYSSQKVDEFLGLDKNEIIGKSIFDFLLPDEILRVSKIFKHAIKNRIPIKDLENWNLDKNGNKFCLLTNGLPLFDEENKIIGFRGVDKNITNEKKFEEAITSSLSLMEATFESIHNGILVVDSKGKIVKTNNKFAEMWKIPQEIIGTNEDKILIECILDQLIDPNGFLNIVNNLYDTPEAESKDIISFKDNRIFERISKPISLDGITTGRVWSFLDITETKVTENELRTSKALFQTLFQTIPDLAWLKDPESVYLACNKKFEDLVGLEEKDIIGKTDFDFFNEQDALFFRENDQKAKETGKSTTNEEWLTFVNDGSRTLLEVIKTPMLNSEGVLIGLLGIARDVTMRYNSKNQIKQKNDELMKINSEKDKFFSIIAHDLRSPFSAFLGITQIMLEDLPSLTLSQIQKMAENLQDSATKLYGLLENLLQWTRSQQGLIPFKPEYLLLKNILEDSVSMVLEAAKLKNIAIEINVLDEIEVYADRNILPIIIRNLVSNAVKFTKKGGKIFIDAETTKLNSVKISIKDTGIGMDKELLKDLFKIDIETNRRGTENESSSGLGLLLCKEFVEKHGGELWAESEVDKGSTFYFTLPL
jgi:PAS domain S-box-containing protein